MTENVRDFPGCHNFPTKIFVYWKSKKVEQCKEYFEVIPLHNNLCVFIIISALLHLLHLLVLHKSLIYPYFMYNGCSKDLRGEYGPVKKAMRNYRSSHRRCSVKKVFLEISQNSQENTCARVPFLIMLEAWGIGKFGKKLNRVIYLHSFLFNHYFVDDTIR